MTKSFPTLLEDYVLVYAKKEAGYSGKTLRSYYTGIEQYVNWLTSKHSIKAIDIDPSSFSKEKIKEFLNYIVNENGASIKTRNLRRAGIVSFLAYASDVCPVYANAYLNSKTIKVKKSEQKEQSFLTNEELEAILKSIDIARRSGYMHYILISVMYDTGARVDEAVRLNIEDFSFGKENSVNLFGKGNKYRTVYITSHAANLIKDYIKRSGRTEGPLFLNRYKERITDSGVDYVLKKYSKLAAQNSSSLKKKVISPHTLRRSKATHMLLNGASLPVIQRFLGHKSITTTEIYLNLGSEAMIKATEEAGKKYDAVNPNTNGESWKDPDVITKLKRYAK